MGHNESSSKREVYRNTGLPQNIRKKPKQSNLRPKGTGKTNKPKVSRRKGIIKIREEINDTKAKTIIEKINETE